MPRASVTRPVAGLGLDLGLGLGLVLVLALAGCAPGTTHRDLPADSSRAAAADSFGVPLVDTAGLPPAEAGVRRLLPVDEGPRVPDFAVFRARLRAAVAAHDTTALVAALDPNLKISFGGDDGIANFRSKWNLGSPDSPLWHELGAVLALGGSFRGDSIFTAPYTFSDWPDDLDAFEHLAIVGRDVVLRPAPRADAEPIARLSFEILRLPPSGAAPTEEADGWTRVQWRDRIGYVASEFVRFALDYRAIFSRKDGVWKIVIFVAGD